MRKFFTFLLGLVACCASAQVTINVDLTARGHEVSPMLYGIFFEDINHAADGGLYAELIRNRSFEERPENIVAWKALSGSSISLVKDDLLNEAQAHALRLEVHRP